MDLQTILDNIVATQRAEAMKTSEQLTLGEIILKLDAIADKSKPVYFDDKRYHPTGIDSWRGSYNELALEYEEVGKPLVTLELLALLRNVVGATLYGYKGGDFLMGKTTPVWVANYGESCGFKEDTQAVVGVAEDGESVLIKTKCMEY